MAQAMDARGFGAQPCRTVAALQRMRIVDWGSCSPARSRARRRARSLSASRWGHGDRCSGSRAGWSYHRRMLTLRGAPVPRRRPVARRHPDPARRRRASPVGRCWSASWLPRDRDGAWDRGRHPGWFAPAAVNEVPGLLARLSVALAERGVASLRYDPRGCGASDGAWESTDLFTRIDDARDAIGAMRSRRDLDLRRTAIVGHGEGAHRGHQRRHLRSGHRRRRPHRCAGAIRGGTSCGAASRSGLARGGPRAPDRRRLDAAAEDLIERAERREPSMRAARR